MTNAGRKRHLTDDNTAIEPTSPTNSKKRIYVCQICDQSFSKRQYLRQHSAVHTVDPIKCEICNQVFVSKQNLKTHMVTHTGEKPFECDVCGQRFTRLHSMRRHKLMQHDDYDSGNSLTKPYICHICCKSFTHKIHFDDHVRIHESVKDDAKDVV